MSHHVGRRKNERQIMFITPLGVYFKSSTKIICKFLKPLELRKSFQANSTQKQEQSKAYFKPFLFKAECSITDEVRIEDLNPSKSQNVQNVQIRH